MKKLIVVASLFLSSVSMGEVITCFFTEPFFKLIYNTQTRILSINNVQYANIDLLFTSTRSMKVVGQNNFTVMDLSLNNNGSDGMSDRNYPFEAIWNMPHGGKHHGGCETTLLKSK